MPDKGRTTVELFESSSVQNRRLLRQEELILKAATALSELLEREGITKVELAKRLGKTKGFVTQILAGDKNLTLRTIADVADALGHRVDVGVAAVARRPVGVDVRLKRQPRAARASR
ncbi:MAG TPA: helix-turn-helix transcriptional regulator [Vicinamibacteria bacterium]|nr:helix-turn-helix transcriptional regulator [Vicinamibacteria bacterium]